MTQPSSSGPVRASDQLPSGTHLDKLAPDEVGTTAGTLASGSMGEALSPGRHGRDAYAGLEGSALSQAQESMREPHLRVGTVVGGTGQDRTPEAAPALDRPSAPILAGAALAGLVLVVAPFAVVGAGPAMSLNVSSAQNPLSGSFGGEGPGQTGVQGGDPGTNSASAVTEGGGSPVTDVAEDTGYVPEIRDDISPPPMPDPGDQPQAEGAAPVEASVSTGDDASSHSPNSERIGASDVSATDSEATRDGGPEAGTAEPEGADAAPLEGADGQAGTDGETEPMVSSESQEGTVDPEPAGDTGASEPQGVLEPHSADGVRNEDSTILDKAIDGVPTVDETYLAISGPGCPTSQDASYVREGRGEGEDGTSAWVTRSGGYEREGCEGDYDALPVSADPEQGDGRYAMWTFAPGREGAECDLYVHVPDDESPQWIAPGETTYRIHPGPDTDQPPVATFDFDQSQARGGWVKVTGFVTESEEFTVQLTNAGEQHGDAHVAASAVRVSCS